MRVPFWAAPISWLASRSIYGPTNLKQLASYAEVLCPVEIGEETRAFFLPDQFDRITGTFSGGSRSAIETEIQRATSPSSTHAATIAYHIENATIVNGSVYARNHKTLITNERPTKRRPNSSYLRRAALVSSEFGTRYFGHWLADDCIQYLLADQIGTFPLCLARSQIKVGVDHLSHQKQYEMYFGQDWTPVDRCRVDELIIFEDYGQNSLKRQRYDRLRRRLCAKISAYKPDSFVYLRRGDTGVSRIVENEAEIENDLLKRGFLILDVAKDSLVHVLRTLMDAKLVVSMEGSHLSHFLYTVSRSGAILTLQPPHKFDAVQRGPIECLGIRFGFVIGRKASGGSSFSIQEILRTIDLMFA